MKNITLFVTTETIEGLKKNYINTRLFSIVSVPELLVSLKLSYDNLTDANKFLLSYTIDQTIHEYLRGKNQYILYINPYISIDTIQNLHATYLNNHNIKKIVLFDRKTQPKNENLWQFFYEIAFFPEIKKQKILNCERILIKHDGFN